MKLLKETLDKIVNCSKNSIPALMTHMVLGYPSLKESEDIVVAMANAGTSIIELQIPFSDPIADGATIMNANEVARQNGITTSDCFAAMERLAKRVSTPLLFMSYANLVLGHKGGIAGFLKSAKNAGAQGMIVPDMPQTNDIDCYWIESERNKLVAIPFVSPLTSSERMKSLVPKAEKGFVYCISTTSTTGAKGTLPSDLAPYLKRVRRSIKAPIAVGFGISKPAHIRSLKGLADIAIVGSATIDVLRKSPKTKRSKNVERFVNSLCKAATT